MKIKTALFLLLTAFFLIQLPQIVTAQKFSPEVRSFIKIQKDTFALTDAIIIDGTGAAVKHHQTILVENGRIAGVGDEASIKLPQNITVINCTGKSIIPGMIMMHEHLFYGESVAPFYLAQEMPVSFPQLYLAGGVTTMRTTGSIEPQTDLNIKTEINDGQLVGPDIDVTGPYIERAGLPIPELLHIKSPSDAAKEVNYWADMGCTSFKLYQDLTRADAKAAIDAAHKRGLKITGHLCSITFREAADLGIDNLEHGFFVSSDFEKNKKEDQCGGREQLISIIQLPENSPDMKTLMQYLIKKNVAITSTLPVLEPASGRDIFSGNGGEALVPEIREKIEKDVKAHLNKDSALMTMFKKEMFWEKQFSDMGGRLMAGIDPTGAGRVVAGYSDRHTLELLEEAGFSLPLAVKICSLNAAEYLGRDQEVGTIEKGKRADLVLINGDIEKDIKNVDQTEIVFKNGVGFDSQKIFDAMKGNVGLY